MDKELHDPHFLRHVSALSEKREVVAHVAIFSRNGIKLIDSGHAVTPALYDRLVAHKLLPPLEECLAVADAVSPKGLMCAVEEMIEQEDGLSVLAPGEAARRELIHVFGSLPISAPLAFKLTVAAEERPELFRHSLRAAWCAAALAYHSRLAHHEIANAAAAGLFHDLGLLHIDPELLVDGRPLREHERRHLYSHPLTAYLVLARDPLWHPAVSTAVLEHHERLDGSGYPKGVGAADISQLGRLLAVAELAATMLSTRDADAGRQRLGVVLRMNEGKLDHELLNTLLKMFPREDCGAAEHLLGRVLETLVEVAIAFLRWGAMRASLGETAIAEFIDRRIERLNHSLAAAGIDLERWSAIDAEVEFDPSALCELDAAAHEGLWQLRAIAHEARRRWSQLAPDDAAALAAASDWLEGVEAIAV